MYLYASNLELNCGAKSLATKSTSSAAGLSSSKRSQGGGSLALCVIDPQRDFHKGGSLAVPGADEDARRFSEWLKLNMDNVSEIFVTLDTHQRFHIAHALFWKKGSPAADGKNGVMASSAPPKVEHPAPFTLISVEDVETGKWVTTVPELQAHALSYVKKLKEGNRFSLIIWPDHCIIGTPGHTVQEDIEHGIRDWEDRTCRAARYVIKGNNSLTEHYSAIRAEVEIESDPNTKLNRKFISDLKQFDKVVLCGQAVSHCVNFTVRDLVTEWPEERLADLVILSDCSSSVSGFEKEGTKFLQEMEAKGVTVTTTAKFAF